MVDLISLLEYRLVDLYMKDSMVAAYMLDPANVLTTNGGATFNLPWRVLSVKETNQFSAGVSRLGGKLALKKLLKLRNNGIRFKSELDKLSAEDRIAAAKDGAGEVVAIADIEVRRNL